MTQTVKFITLGCKVNQYESQAMSEKLAENNLQDISGSAEACSYVVINTCTVTAEADKNNRYWIRRMRRENPSAKLVVTGCYVEKNRADLETMPEVDLILSNYDKDKIMEKIFEGCGTDSFNPSVCEEFSPIGAATAKTLQHATDKTKFATLEVAHSQAGATRAFVKIQDGCNHSCSFCKVVLVRGRSRSRELENVIDEVKRLAEHGHKEVVFAGIQLGAYGLDFEAPEHFRKPVNRDRYFLIDVIEQSAEIPGIERIRLSSIEPIDIGDPLIECMRRVSKFCPQLHIPLQSGDSEILNKMNRRYSREFYLDLIMKLREQIPDFELSLDVMAGFPGEETVHFQNTLDLIEKIEPLKCHVFPYSRREGTRAAAFQDVAPTLIRDRVRQISTLADQAAQKRMQRYVGRTMTVLAEMPREKNGFFEGLTANYLRVCFPSSEPIRGQLLPVEILTAQDGLLLGRLVLNNLKQRSF